MQISIEVILNLVSVLFGGTGVVAFVAARQERKANAFVTMQGIYDKLTLQTDDKLDEMRQELTEMRQENKELKETIKKLEKTVNENERKCSNCSKK